MKKMQSLEKLGQCVRTQWGWIGIHFWVFYSRELVVKREEVVYPIRFIEGEHDGGKTHWRFKWTFWSGEDIGTTKREL